MKKTLFTLLFLVTSIALFSQVQYYVRVNGTTDYPANQIGEPDYQGRTQYLATGIKLESGDVVTFYDAANDAEFADAALEEYDEGQFFTQTETGFTCNKTGCFDFYLKLKWEDNTLYIGPGTNCDGENPPVNPPVNPSDDGEHTYWLIGWFDGVDVGDASDFNAIHDEYKFINGKLKTRFTNASGAGFSYACIKDSEGNWYMTKAWDDQINTASSVTLYWTGFQYTEPNKWRLPNEQDLYIIMDKVDFKNEIQLRLVDKATFDAYSLNNDTPDVDALENLFTTQFSVSDGMINTNGTLRILNLLGQDVTNQNGSLHGLYIVTINGKTSKLLIK